MNFLHTNNEQTTDNISLIDIDFWGGQSKVSSNEVLQLTIDLMTLVKK